MCKAVTALRKHCCDCQRKRLMQNGWGETQHSNVAYINRKTIIGTHICKKSNSPDKVTVGTGGNGMFFRVILYYCCHKHC